MHSRQYQLLLALLRYVYILLHICHGLFVVAIVVLVILLTTGQRIQRMGARAATPTFGKEVSGQCPLLHYFLFLPSNYTDPRGGGPRAGVSCALPDVRGSGQTLLQRSLGYLSPSDRQ